ncbi:hypothetical protein LSS_17625 [Leptospira santarosai serovar Shermani str. LT 821]|uniref:Uncharacterized protein n=1 Tax=Leptospira santarosai serovar Shermani str. LT 821 TaxID=758847 RepID=K8XV62_9LEPT|nr:hypothetical protein LSS_17625 [Leptospira santarosai serovar Shermani str. LT 821]
MDGCAGLETDSSRGSKKNMIHGEYSEFCIWLRNGRTGCASSFEIVERDSPFQ